MIATAGKILTEQELRALFKCSRLYGFGGTVEAEVATLMAQYATEYYISAKLRAPGKDNSMVITKAVFHAAKKCQLKEIYLAGQEEELINKTVLWLDEFMTVFDESTYLPVTGPLPWRTVVGKTPIDLQISGILRTRKNQTLHALSFSPFKNAHAQVNDPATHLKLKELQEFVKKNPNRPRARMHILWANNSGGLSINNIDSKKINPEYLNVIEQRVKQAERAEYIPLVPCPHRYCKFLKKCFIGEKND